MANAVAFKSGSRVQVGMVVRLTGRSRGHAIVTKMRFLQRGKRSGSIEYTLAPVAADQWGRAFAARVIGERFFAEPTVTVSEDVAENRINGVFEAFDKVSEVRERRANEGCNAIVGSLAGVAGGAKVLVKYRDGARIETFIRSNIATGKVAISRPGNKTGMRWIPADLVEVVK